MSPPHRRPGKRSLRRREQLICPTLEFLKFITFDRRRLVLRAAQSFVGPVRQFPGRRVPEAILANPDARDVLDFG
jgi:hypothetical protein